MPKLDNLGFNARVGLLTLRRAGRRISRLLGGKDEGPDPLALNNRIIREGAEAIGCQVEELPNRFLRISRDGRSHYTRSADCDFESLMAWQLCGDKRLTQTILAEAELPVPPFICVDRHGLDAAEAFRTAQGGPLVTKPAGGAGGFGVTIGIDNRVDLARGLAAAYAAGFGPIMVERHVEGSHYRLTVLDDEVLSVVERIPAHVIGDGVSTLGALIETANENAGAPGNPQIRPIPTDRQTRVHLRRQRLAMDSVPGDGERVFLRAVCNADQGGHISDVGARAHPDHIDIARRAARTMGARLAGVDLICTDIGSAFEPGHCWINEVNTTPALYIAEAPDAPEPRDIGKRIAKRLLGPQDP